MIIEVTHSAYNYLQICNSVRRDLEPIDKHYLTNYLTNAELLVTNSINKG